MRVLYRKRRLAEKNYEIIWGIESAVFTSLPWIHHCCTDGTWIFEVGGSEGQGGGHRGGTKIVVIGLSTDENWQQVLWPW